MKTHDYCKLAARHLTFIIILTAIATLGGYGYFHLKSQPEYSTTLFMTLGIKNDHDGNKEENNYYSENNYYNFQAADQFTETIQGWFKNPAFLNKVNTLSGLSSSISAAKQEKQNLIINYDTPTSTDAVTEQNAIIKTLTNEMSAYNLSTSSQVEVAVNSAQTNPKSQSSLPYLAIAFILGLFSSFGLSFLLEKMHGTVTSACQVKKLYKNQILEEFSNEKDLQKNGLILKKKAGILTMNSKEKLQIILVGTHYKNLSSQLKKILDGKKIEEIHFPKDLEKVNTTAPTLLFCQLGKSKIKDLKRVRSLISSERGIIILN